MPKLENLESRIAELETAVSVARRGEELARTELALSGKVAPSLVEAAALLLSNRGAVRRDLDNAIVFQVPGMPLDLTEGVAAWTKSPEAKDFLPRRRTPTGRERVREEFLGALRRVSDGTVDDFELKAKGSQ